MTQSSRLEDYFSDCLEVIETTPVTRFTKSIQLGEHYGQLITFSEDLENCYLPSLKHLVLDDCDSAFDLTIFYVSDEDLATTFPVFDWNDIEFDAQGFAQGLDQEKIAVFFQPWLKQVFLYSYEHKTAIYRTKTTAEVPWWEATFSFRILLHFWSKQTPYQLMHAGALAIDSENAVLMPAPSGSGKSTTSCYLQEAGYGYLGDDYVLVDTENARVYKLYGCAKVEWDNLEERFPHLLNQCVNLEFKPKQKGVFYPKEEQSSNHGHNIRAIITPNLSEGQKGFASLSAGRSVLSIAPTTLHHLPHHRQKSLIKIKNLTKSSKNYIWNLPPQRHQVVQQFKQFIDEHIS